MPDEYMNTNPITGFRSTLWTAYGKNRKANVVLKLLETGTIEEQKREIQQLEELGEELSDNSIGERNESIEEETAEATDGRVQVSENAAIIAPIEAPGGRALDKRDVAGLDLGDPWYFVYADENYAAVWRNRDSWSGDAYKF